MMYTKRFTHLPSSPLQYVIALVIVAAIAFSLGVATDFVGRSASLTQTAAAPAVRAVPAAQAPFAVRDLYAGWTLYDSGWAGGPGLSATASTPTWDVYAGSELYDGGWAGGPGPSYRQGTTKP